MVQPTRAPETGHSREADTRAGQLRQGIWIELVTIIWMVMEAGIFLIQEGREALHQARTGETWSCCAGEGNEEAS